MKKLLHIIVILSNSFISRGQPNIGNYVSNGSVESLNSLSLTSYVECIEYWHAIDTNMFSAYHLATTIPAIANAPYFQGYQFARTGKNYMIVTILCYNCVSPYLRWYPRNRLKKPLKANTTYCVKFYLNSPNKMALGTDSYGAYFGDINLDTIKYCTLPLTYITPQIQNQPGNVISDTLRWIPITGTFVATGTEKYMVLGNFRSDASTNIMVVNTSSNALFGGIDICIDDVSVIEMNLPAYAGRDTTVLPGSSVFIGREPDFALDSGCVWYKWPNMAVPIDTISGFWVNPTTTTTYMVKQILDCSPEKWDTVVVTVDPTVRINKLKNQNEGLELFPNPANQFLELKIRNAELSSWKTTSIYNSLGQLIREEEFRTKLRTEDLVEGVYFLELSGSQGRIRKRFLIAR